MVIAERIEALRRHEMVAQLVRFAVTGVAITLLYAAVYWPIATYGHRILSLGGPHGRGGAEWPLIGVVIAFAVATVVGNVAHSRISFRGHGSRDARTAHRFFIVQMFGFGLNAFFTWLLTGPLIHGATWLPLLPAATATPLLTFWVQRNWVFA